MDDLTSLVESVVSHIGRAFFLTGFMPLVVFVAVNQYLIFAPAYSSLGEIWSLFPMVTTPWLGLFSGQLLTTLVVAFLLSLVLVPLNALVIRLFEGLVPGVRVLMYPLYAFRSYRYKRHYAKVESMRSERRALLAKTEQTGEYDEESAFAIFEELHRLHSEKEKQEPVQTLPYERRRLTPTLFGNAWAVMEEQPYARYGMDSMVFWPYVRVAVGRENPDLLAQIDNQKLLVEVVINLALVMAVLLVEGIVFSLLRIQWQMGVLAALALLFFWAFYQAGVNYTRTMGMMVTQCFDLYRLQVLDDFGLARPSDLDDEYWTWTRLSAFLRRSEPFYFDMLTRQEEADLLEGEE